MRKLPLLRTIQLLFAAAMCWFAATARAIPEYPFLEELWRPEAKIVVATFDGDPISQEDVFLWQAIRGRDPLVARLATQQGTDVRALRPLEDAVRDLVQARLLAEDAEKAGLVEAWYREKGGRVLAAPIAVMVFADLWVRPEVQVEEEDILYAYRQGGDRFREPARVEVVRLRIPLPENPDQQSIVAARAQAESLRAEAVQSGGLKAVLAAHPEFAMDQPAGSTIFVVRGSGQVTREAEDEIFRLSPSQITRPLSQLGGVTLLEVVSREGDRKRSFDSVHEEIASRLSRRFFRQQLEYRAAEAEKNARPVSRVKHYALLDDSMELLIVGKFILTKGEFKTLFPDAAAAVTGKPTRALIDKTRFVVESEAIAQVLDREGLVAHPRYERGLELAQTLAAARKVLGVAKEVPDPSETELREYAERNRAELAPAWSSVLWKLTAQPKTPAELGAAERAQLVQTMQETMDGLVAESERLLGDRARLNGPTVLVSPQFVVERVTKADHDDFTVTFQQAGEFAQRPAREELGIDLSSIEVGRFSPPLPRGDGSVTAYYRADKVEKPAPSEEELLARARTAWRREVAENPARERLAQLESQGRLVFKFARPE